MGVILNRCLMVTGLAISSSIPGSVFAQTVASGAGDATAVPPVQQFELQTATSAYRLGPGDVVEITALGLPEMGSNRVILTDGTVTLPMVGTVRLTGLSQEEAGNQLSEMYRTYLKEPQFTVAVANPRPVSVTVLGEVNRPGPYTLGPAANTGIYYGTAGGTSTKNNTGQGSIGGAGGGRLTVSQALSIAGGVNEVADVRKIQLIRQLSQGRKSAVRVDLWAMMQNADTSQDQSLVDGDAIVVPKVEPGTPNYSNEVVNASTLAPSVVEVKVIGEVNRPGVVAVAPGAPMTDALVAAGGLTNDADPRAVQLMRLNTDGTVTALSIDAKLEQGRDPLKNPSLKKGDLIRVQRSFGAGLIRGLGDILNPIFLFNSFRNFYDTVRR